MRVILHADLNSFFASVEQQDNPDYRGKPLGILKAKGRSCIIAASNEAKKLGVTTGCNIYKAKQLCPEIILVPARFARYEEITKKFINLTADFSDRVEVFSLDEVFLDVTDTAWWFGGAMSLARKLQARVAVELGVAIGCSIGIAANKFLAKLASGIAPKRGILQVTKENQQELLVRAPFTEVCGIGYRLTQRLKGLGINSLAQIQAAPDSLLLANFGPFWGRELKRLSLGFDDSLVVTTAGIARAKSVSRTFTLYSDTTDSLKIKAFLRNLVEEAAAKLRQMGLVGRQFGVGIRGAGQAQTGHITGKTVTANGRDIFEQIYTIYKRWHWRRPVRFAGVWITKLAARTDQTEWLFNQPRRDDYLWQIVDRVNHRYGTYTIFPGTLIKQRIIRPEVNGYLGDKYFRLALR